MIKPELSSIQEYKLRTNLKEGKILSYAVVVEMPDKTLRTVDVYGRIRKYDKPSNN